MTDENRERLQHLTIAREQIDTVITLSEAAMRHIDATGLIPMRACDAWAEVLAKQKQVRELLDIAIKRIPS
jgi:hypothetical protein